ncbi:MAG: hypothetical protein K2G89_09895, partial [Lachnospiraceae bacterium]|nr:hypothetical protein [Lachnospiraceae bacterium]
YIGDGGGWKEAGGGSDITLGAHKSGHGIEAFMLSIANCPEKRLQYRAYVRNIGWTRWTAQGEVCGVPGSAKPIEAVQLSFTDSAAAGFAGNKENTFIYKTHGEKEKWSAWAKSGTSLKVAGKSDYIDSVQLALMNATEGAEISARGYYNGKWQAQSTGTDMKLGRPGGTYPLEAVQISLLNVPDMVLEYRVYIKSLGWTDWCSQSDVAGIPGHGYSLTRIQLRIANAQTAAHAKPSVSYRLKDSKGYGDWMERAKSVKAAGGQKAEKLEVVLLNYPQGAKLKAKAYVEGSGWKEYSSKKCSVVIGTNKKKLQAFRLSLEGTEEYALQYKAYIKGKGWTDWTDQGAYVGTGGKKSKTYITKVMIPVVPVEQPPTTEAPDTEATETEAPTTETPATETPATEMPETEASTTETPETQELTTETPAAKAPESEVPEVPDVE